jgi:hypothetical protein
MTLEMATYSVPSAQVYLLLTRFFFDTRIFPFLTLLSLSTFAVAHTNEFQKRGLPHSHILVWQV